MQQKDTQKLEKKADNVPNKKIISPQTSDQKLQKNHDFRGKSEKETQPKSSNKSLALILILALIGVGAGGYFLHLHANQSHQRLSQLEQKIVQMDNSEQNKQAEEKLNLALEKITESEKALQQKLAMLDQELAIKDQAINALQIQLNRLKAGGEEPKSQGWKIAEGHYLLNTAYRKLTIDKDLPSVIELLKAANQALNHVEDGNILAVRTQISDDLKSLMKIKVVNEEQIMADLTHLTGEINDLMLQTLATTEKAKLSENLADWQENLQKSAESFLTKFIKATPKESDSQALLTPQQEIYLRENLRMRLQIALIAVERHQTELYQQSLRMVSDWVKRYFDQDSETVKSFLIDLDKVQQQSLSDPMPTELQSVKLMKQLTKGGE